MITLTKRLSWRTKQTQWFQSAGCGQEHMIRFMGTCESCGRSVYSHGCAGDKPCGDLIEDSPDPRGVIPPQHCMNLYRASEYGMIGRPVMTCAACAENGDKYRAIITAAKNTGTWKEVIMNYVEMMESEGWQVYSRKDRITGKDAEYCYCTDGTHIAYVQWSNGQPSVSTVHVPNRTTGTGFHFADTITPETIRTAMLTAAPHWARQNELASVHKYKNWDEFHQSNDFNSELTIRHNVIDVTRKGDL